MRRKRQTILVSVPGRRHPVLFKEVNPMFNKIKAYVSASPLVHVVIAAFIGAALPILEPMLQNSADLSFPTVKVALYAGIAAALRALVLAVPSKNAV